MDLAETSRRGTLEALGNIAERQEGYFSAAQAVAAGIERHRLQRLARQGVIERDERGIYRFVVYPHGEQAELWRAVLWPSVQRGNLTTVDLSISRSLRLRRGVPPAYRIHRRDIDPGEVTSLHGLPLTTLFRTLFDLIVSGEDRQFVAEALVEAPRRGLLTVEETKHLRALSAVDPSGGARACGPGS